MGSRFMVTVTVRENDLGTGFCGSGVWLWNLGLMVDVRAGEGSAVEV